MRRCADLDLDRNFLRTDLDLDLDLDLTKADFDLDLDKSDLDLDLDLPSLAYTALICANAVRFSNGLLESG
jgi:hypothetical protein